MRNLLVEIIIIMYVGLVQILFHINGKHSYRLGLNSYGYIIPADTCINCRGVTLSGFSKVLTASIADAYSVSPLHFE
jgi:hypothetical protein